MSHETDPTLLKLERIETILTLAFGRDGNNGRFGKLESQVAAHEAYINTQRGAGRFGHYIWTTVLAFAAALAALWVRGK